MKTITILEVQDRIYGHDEKLTKVWSITRCDDQPELVGNVTASGTPCRAKDVPVGTTYKQVLTIPREKKAKSK
jgi:hypothetical protein